MSICTFIFVFLSFDGHLSTGVMLIVNVIKSLAISGVEFIFAYLFVARNNRTKAERAGYQFDLEGNVVSTPYDMTQHEQNIEKVEVREEMAPTKTEVDRAPRTEIEQRLDDFQESSIVEDCNGEHLHQEQKPTEQMNDVKPAWSRCSCGKTFSNEAEYNEHIQSCEVFKWFNE